jgi:hypothetical protein
MHTYFFIAPKAYSPCPVWLTFASHYEISYYCTAFVLLFVCLFAK